MEQTQTQGAQPELVRPLDGRMVAGVAVGLARRFQVPDWAVRVGFAVTAFMGGLGIVLYVAGWALIRSEDESESIAERFFSQAESTKSWVGIGLIALALLNIVGYFTLFDDGLVWAAVILVVGFLLYSGAIPTPSRPAGGSPTPDPGPGSGQPETTAATFTAQATPAPASVTPPTPSTTTAPPAPRPPAERSYLGRLSIGVALVSLGFLAMLDLSPVPIDPRPRHYLALTTVVLGLGLLVGSFWGRSRSLILAGFILVPALFLSPILDLGPRSDWTIRHRPTTFVDLQDDYRFDFGAVVYDLTQLPWNGQEVGLRIRGDAASIRILVPRDVAIQGRLDAHGVGWLGTPWAGSGGIDPDPIHLDEQPAGASQGVLVLDAAVEVGAIHLEVTD